MAKRKASPEAPRFSPEADEWPLKFIGGGQAMIYATTAKIHIDRGEAVLDLDQLTWRKGAGSVPNQQQP